jgi:hypothetical protein
VGLSAFPVWFRTIYAEWNINKEGDKIVRYKKVADMKGMRADQTQKV